MAKRKAAPASGTAKTNGVTNKRTRSSKVKKEEPEEDNSIVEEQPEEAENSELNPESSPIVVDRAQVKSEQDIYNYDQDDEDDEMTTVDEVKGHVGIELKAKIDTDDEFHEEDHPEPEEDDEEGQEALKDESSKEDGELVSPKKVESTKTTTPKSSSKTTKSSSSSHKSSTKSSSKTETTKTSSKEKSASSHHKSSTSTSKTPDSKPKSANSTSSASKSTASSSKETKETATKKDDGKDSKDKDKKPRTTSSDDSDYDVDYFKRMANRSKDSFHDPTDKELFTENIWKNIKGKELSLTAHKYSTDCMLWFVENVRDNSLLRKFTENVSVDKLTIEALKEESTSQLIESLIETLIRVLMDEQKDDFSSSTAKWIIKYLDGFAKLIIDNLNKLLSDSMNGCRIVIVTIEAVGGIRIGRHWSRQNMRFGSGVRVNLQSEIEKDISFKELPSAFKHQLKRFAKQLVLDAPDSDIKDILFGRATQVAQYLLFVLKVRYPELCQMVVKKLVEIVFANKTDRDYITQSASSAYIVEIIMMVASETRLSKIWTKYLKGELQSLWQHDIANFIVQRLIDAIKEENLFADVCKELFPHLAEIFKYNRAGIGVCLAKACQDYKKMQHDLVNALLKAYECYEPKEKQIDLVPSMLFIEMKDKFNQKLPARIQIWLHGSLMLQYMMAYDDPYKVSKSLLSLSTEDVIKIAKDRSGSHVIDAFIHGDNVAIKHKSELVERFLGQYHNLSMDKFGSRIVENILSLSDNNVKRAIMEELSHHEAKLTANRNGWFVAKKVGLHHFKHRPRDWNETERNRDRKKRTFSEFLSGPLGPNRGRGPSGITGPGGDGGGPGGVGGGRGGGHVGHRGGGSLGFNSFRGKPRFH